MALLYERKASPQTMREKFAESIRRDPANPWPKVCLAFLMLRNQQDEEARERVREVLQIESTPSALRGWCHYMLGQYEEAIRYLRLSIRRTPEDLSAQFDLALVLLADGRSVAGEEYAHVLDATEALCEARQAGLLAVAEMDLSDAITHGIVEPGPANEIQAALRARLERLGMQPAPAAEPVAADPAEAQA
jgi:tetratricopeptide (TPR) repeat protein